MSNFDTHLQEQIDALDKYPKPERDLWAGIEHALVTDEQIQEKGRTKSKVTWLASAAAITFVGVLSWQVIQPSFNNDMNVAKTMSEQHIEQRDALLVKYDGVSAVTENWQEQLVELDQAAAAIRQALDEDPSNMALLRMLQQVHQQQIDLIERVHSPKWQRI